MCVYVCLFIRFIIIDDDDYYIESTLTPILNQHSFFIFLNVGNFYLLSREIKILLRYLMASAGLVCGA